MSLLYKKLYNTVYIGSIIALSRFCESLKIATPNSALVKPLNLQLGSEVMVVSCECDPSHLYPVPFVNLLTKLSKNLNDEPLPLTAKQVRTCTLKKVNKTSICQGRGHGFNPCSGRIPHATVQLRPCGPVTESAL